LTYSSVYDIQFFNKGFPNRTCLIKEDTDTRGNCLVLGLLFLFLTGCAGSSGYMVKATPTEGPAQGKAIVYFMRPSGYGRLTDFQIWDGTYFVGLSQAGSYFAYQCDPGKHLFLGIAENKVAIEADLEGGKSYYIGTGARIGGMRPRMNFTPVTRNSELWDKVDEYKRSLNFIAVKEEERAKWEAAKRQEAQGLVDYYSQGAGKAEVYRLSKEDGR